MGSEISRDEALLPSALELFEKFENGDPDIQDLGPDQRRALNELLLDAVERGHGAREQREVRCALLERVGQEDLREVLLRCLLVSGFGPEQLQRRNAFDEFVLTEREREAIRLSRNKPDDIFDFRDFFC